MRNSMFSRIIALTLSCLCLLASNALAAPDIGSAEVNRKAGTVEAIGIGTERTAAIANCLEKISEAIWGLTVDAETAFIPLYHLPATFKPGDICTSLTYPSTSSALDTIITRVDNAVISNYRIIEEKKLPDGAYTVRMQAAIPKDAL